MIKTTNMLRAELSAYANPDAKIKRMVTGGLLSPIVRGLYETDSTTPRHYSDMNREELATFLCADRSVLSNKLSKMKKECMINYHKTSLLF